MGKGLEKKTGHIMQWEASHCHSHSFGRRVWKINEHLVTRLRERTEHLDVKTFGINLSSDHFTLCGCSMWGIILPSYLSIQSPSENGNGTWILFVSEAIGHSNHYVTIWQDASGSWWCHHILNKISSHKSSNWISDFPKCSLIIKC